MKIPTIHNKTNILMLLLFSLDNLRKLCSTIVPNMKSEDERD